MRVKRGEEVGRGRRGWVERGEFWERERKSGEVMTMGKGGNSRGIREGRMMGTLGEGRGSDDGGGKYCRWYKRGRKGN